MNPDQNPRDEDPLDDLDALLGAFGFGMGPAAHTQRAVVTPPFAATAARMCQALAAEPAPAPVAGTPLTRVEAVSVWLLMHHVWAIVMGDRSSLGADNLDPESARAGEQWLTVVLTRLDRFDQVDLRTARPHVWATTLRELGPQVGVEAGAAHPTPAELGVLTAWFATCRDRLRADWRGEPLPAQTTSDLMACEQVGNELVLRLRPWLLSSGPSAPSAPSDPAAGPAGPAAGGTQPGPDTT